MVRSKELDQLAINSIRVLSMDAVQKANSGHPGTPIGAAPMAYTLWSEVMKHNPGNPNWHNRDRFVLSVGHASMLIYSLLHLFDYGLELEELKNFRQWGSKTPGHPEYGHTVGVETTTGPLGQGIATAVGMALAEAHKAARFNRPGYPIVDHWTYTMLGDGCMMEGVASEAASLAGTLKLGKLIAIYDSNRISIEGDTDLAMTENVGMRFEAYGWQVLRVEDGNDTEAVKKALEAAKAETSKPSLVIVKTQIAYGTPLAGSEKTHGNPLGAENVAKTREYFNWPLSEAFAIPQEVYDYMAEQKTALAESENEWNKLFAEWEKEYPELAAQYKSEMAGDLPDLASDPDFWNFSGQLAPRKASEMILTMLGNKLPNFIGGSADLAHSNYSEMQGIDWLSPENYAGRNIHFGVREFAMADIVNGLILHGGLFAYGATFLVFSDYQKAAIRLAAIMNLPSIFVLTHDSIGVGEDGPTHEPIEHLTALRATPNVTVWRPADGKETAAGYILALSRKGPTAMALAKQNLITLDESGPIAMRGGYILKDTPDPQALIIATGSEVEIAVAAYEQLKESGINVRVVSMPSTEVFEEQDEEYKAQVLPASIKARVAVEAGATMPWCRYVGLDGEVVGIDHFGASAPAPVLFREFGFTPENVVAAVERVIAK